MSLPTAYDEVYEAIYERLTNDATLMALITGIYDDVPDASSFPYIQLGEPIELPFDAFANQGKQVTVPIHVWSRYNGNKECSDIQSRIATLLDRYALSVDGMVLTRCVFESGRVMRDPDGMTRHGLQQFVIEVSES